MDSRVMNYANCKRYYMPKISPRVWFGRFAKVIGHWKF